MVGSLFQNHNIHAVGGSKEYRISMYIDFASSAVGADRIARNGDTANKVSLLCTLQVRLTENTCQIGTYNAAVLASRHKIPFIVVAPVSTVDLDIADGTW